MATKKAKIVSIKLKDINDTVGVVENAARIIRTNLSRAVLFRGDYYKIAFNALSSFSFLKNKYSYNNRNSVIEQCSAVLTKFGFYHNGKIVELFKSKEDQSDYDPLFHFVKHIIGFYKLPGEVLHELELLVKSDLRELLELIALYEKDPIIAEYKTGIRRPEHKWYLRISFYERCLKEKEIIVNHLANGLEDRAVSKASQDDMFKRSGLLWFESYWDRPYKWWQHRSIEFFDYRKINLCRHRLGEVRVKEIPGLEQLYHLNKPAFYRKLQRTISPGHIFDQLKNYYIPALPKQSERKPVFEELEKLMRSRRWFGFTSLALTQVEGVFSDMLHVIDPKKNIGSLSKKVLAVRPHYNFEERNFDYFEFHLPFLRNSFLHSGSIAGNDFKTLSLDLLYDLHYLYTVFHVLNDPYIELHKFLNKNSTDTLPDVKAYNHIFSLVKVVRERNRSNPSNKQFSIALEKWNAFQKETIVPSAELEFIAEDIMMNLDKQLHDFFDLFRIYTSHAGTEINFEKTDLKTIQQNEEVIKNTVKYIPADFIDSHSMLIEIVKFSKFYKTFLPDCSDRVVEIMDDIRKRHKLNFVKLEALWKFLNNE